MGLLEDLMGPGTAQTQRRREFEDFVNRYDQGHPSEGYSDQEVLERYRDVAHAVPADQYAQAAQEALARLSPEEREAFVRMLQQRAQSRGMPLPRRVGTSPEDLGSVLSDLHQTPGRLRDLLGGGTTSQTGQQAPSEGTNPITSMLSSPLAKAALAGIAAMVVKRVLHGGGRADA